eukprot:263724_1
MDSENPLLCTKCTCISYTAPLNPFEALCGDPNCNHPVSDHVSIEKAPVVKKKVAARDHTLFGLSGWIDAGKKKFESKHENDFIERREYVVHSHEGVDVFETAEKDSAPLGNIPNGKLIRISERYIDMMKLDEDPPKWIPLYLDDGRYTVLPAPKRGSKGDEKDNEQKEEIKENKETVELAGTLQVKRQGGDCDDCGAVVCQKHKAVYDYIVDAGKRKLAEDMGWTFVHQDKKTIYFKIPKQIMKKTFKGHYSEIGANDTAGSVHHLDIIWNLKRKIAKETSAEIKKEASKKSQAARRIASSLVVNRKTARKNQSAIEKIAAMERANYAEIYRKRCEPLNRELSRAVASGGDTSDIQKSMAAAKTAYTNGLYKVKAFVDDIAVLKCNEAERNKRRRLAKKEAW